MVTPTLEPLFKISGLGQARKMHCVELSGVKVWGFYFKFLLQTSIYICANHK